MDEPSKPRMCLMAEWRDISLVRVGQLPVRRGTRKPPVRTGASSAAPISRARVCISPSTFRVPRLPASARKRWGNRRFANSPIDIPILGGKCVPSERVPLLDFHGLPPKSSARPKGEAAGQADIPLFNGKPTRVDTLKKPSCGLL